MLPRIILHNELSVDGRIDWLQGDMGLYYELAAHWPVQAMLSGSNTLLQAYPPEQLEAQDPSANEPPDKDLNDPRQLLVVADSRGRLRNWHLLRQEPYWRDVVALCSLTTPESYLEYLQERRVDYIVTGESHVDLPVALEELNTRYGVEVLRVDSGGILNGVLLRAGLVDEVSVLINPSLIGGTSPSSIFQAEDLSSPERLIRLELIHLEQVRNDIVWLRYNVIKGDG